MRKRADILKGETEKVKTGCGSMYLTINNGEDNLPCEVRLQMGKSGSCVRSMLEVIGILLSIILQHIDKPVVTKAFKRHMRGVGCGSEFRIGDKRYSSCLDKIAECVLIKMKEE